MFLLSKKQNFPIFIEFFAQFVAKLHLKYKLYTKTLINAEFPCAKNRALLWRHTEHDSFEQLSLFLFHV